MLSHRCPGSPRSSLKPSQPYAPPIFPWTTYLYALLHLDTYILAPPSNCIIQFKHHFPTKHNVKESFSNSKIFTELCYNSQALCISVPYATEIIYLLHVSLLEWAPGGVDSFISESPMSNQVLNIEGAHKDAK